MIASLVRLDFVYDDRSFRLLDFGDFIAEEIALPISIKGSDYDSTGAAWGEGNMEGRAKRSLSWQVRREHASARDVRSFCMRHGELIPKMVRGVLRYSIIDADFDTSAPEIWELRSTRILAAEPMPSPPGKPGAFRSLTTYRVETSRARPTSIITPFPGLPVTWYNQPASALTMAVTTL